MSIDRKKFFFILGLIFLFGLLYWIAGYSKNFHANEFQSWVYAKKCSFFEILTLKDTGIGHPPLYHLLQKTVQSFFNTFHPFQVRLVNFIAGVVFTVTLTLFLLKNNINLFFRISVIFSAGFLNAFVFGRMWGVVCLFSLILLWAAEEYYYNREYKNALVLILIFILGLLADYNFIILAPFVFFIFMMNQARSRKLLTLSFTILFGIWISSKIFLFIGKNMDFQHIFYDSIRDFTKICYEINFVLFKWEFQEFIWISLVLFFLVGVIILFLERKHIEANFPVILPFIILAFFVVGSLFDIAIVEELIRVRYVFFLSIILFLLFFNSKLIKNIELCSFNTIMLLGFFGAIFLLISVSPIFWKDLRNSRYLMILFPFLVLLLVRNFPQRFLNFVSILFIISGIFYISSGSVDDLYPPPIIDTEVPIVFSSPDAYSSHYLRSEDQKNEFPYILDFFKFKKNCRVCEMGTRNVPFDKIHSFDMIAEQNFDYIKYIPKEFRLTETKIKYRSNFDRFLYQNLNAVSNPKYYIYTFVK